MKPVPWVCLMYHDVVTRGPMGGGGPERFTVTRGAFAAMLDWVRAEGYAGCSLETALRPGSHRPVAITFDDGTSGQFENAAPALVERGMTATFFVVTDWVGTPGFMTWDELRQLKAWGMSVQSHSRSHPHMSEIDEARLRSELADSKARLDEELAQETTQIALPAGDKPRRGFRHLFGEVGYRVVATSRWGTNARDAREAGAAAVWIRRCTVPRELDRELALRILAADARLGLTRYWREAALNAVRAGLGASRYARWRRKLLHLIDRPAS
ncbi:MAG TPA: polysaccharide deacetylase family protein [Longimicrobiales bacterium]|nr:polysaccharide deacetylase family protein [Longimicrobiales bacterium]